MFFYSQLIEQYIVLRTNSQNCSNIVHLTKNAHAECLEKEKKIFKQFFSFLNKYKEIKGKTI